MKYLFLFFIFFNSYAYADLFDNVLNVTELELADKIEEAQRNIKAPFKD